MQETRLPVAYFTAMLHPRFAAAVGLTGLVLTACSSAPAAPTALENSPQPVVTSAGGGTSGGATGGSSSAAGSTGGSTGTGSTGGLRPGGTTGGTGGSTGTAPGGTAGAGTTGQPPVDTSSVHLFTPSEDRIGITPTSITMCAHAALTYGAAFHTQTSDLNVFWTAMNAKGGVFGRKVGVTYENDNYDPQTAVTAAKTCVAKRIFMLLGGIGFDQIPTVRNYAESVHQLYLYHTATINGSQGLKYSFSELPTVERVGEGFAQLALQKFKGKKIGILKRDSSNWEPGVAAFMKQAKKDGLNVVDQEKAAASAGNYTNQITALRNHGAQVVWIWLNALESTEVVEQMKAQAWSPNLMVFPFNLTSQTLKNDAMNPPMDGVAMYPAYSNKDYSGTFANYADDMKEFEAQYAQYDSGADLSGVGGDLLFLNWVAQKALYRQLLMCGKDCTRNRFVEVLQHYDQVPISSGCKVDFVHGDHHHGGQAVTFMQTYRSPSGAVNWRETKQCVNP
ncbi:MAG: amino acid/amide transporter substrate-binding protein family [Frankiales bacterium]|nr:amino acid/amide transporter substrate-binding protein family [Frankiales bacterium]